MGNKRKLDEESSFLVKTVLGISPIPIVGEIALSSLYYNLLNDYDSGMKYLAIPAAVLTRFGMYSTVYAPLYERLLKMIS